MLRLYVREGCHLCENAARALSALGLAFEEVSVAANPALERLYGWDIPVLVRLGEGGEEVLAKGVLSPARLRRLHLG